MKTVALSDASVVPVIDLKAVHVHRHFWKSDEYYVQILMRDGSSRDVLEHVPVKAAQAERDALVSLIRQAWDEIQPFEYGCEVGRDQGRSEGHSNGFAAGKLDGHRTGWAGGWTEGRRSILSYLADRREELMREEGVGGVHPPSRRRYVRNSIDLLTSIIHEICPEPNQNGPNVP